MAEKDEVAPFVVVPEFRVKPGTLADFLEAAMDDARHSLADEAGCRQFDIVCPENSPDVVIFYEVYDDRAAFEAHLRTPHLKRFQEAMSTLKVEETVVRFACRKYP